MIEIDEDDLDRVAKAVAAEMAIEIAALRRVAIRAQDRVFLRRAAAIDPLHLSDNDRARIRSLCWRYRHALPAHLRPKLNPDDPVVRELEAA